MANKSPSLKLKKEQKQALSYMGAFAGGTLGGMFLRGRYAGPLGLAGAIGGIALNKPYVAAASMGMMFSLPMDFVMTGGSNLRTSGANEPFSIKNELNNGVSRTKTFFQGMAHKLWLDKIFGKKSGKEAGEMVDQSGNAGENGDLGFLGNTAAATLDRIERNIMASAMQFDQARAAGYLPTNVEAGPMHPMIARHGNVADGIDLLSI